MGKKQSKDCDRLHRQELTLNINSKSLGRLISDRGIFVYKGKQ